MIAHVPLQHTGELAHAAPFFGCTNPCVTRHYPTIGSNQDILNDGPRDVGVADFQPVDRIIDLVGEVDKIFGSDQPASCRSDRGTTLAAVRVPRDPTPRLGFSSGRAHQPPLETSSFTPRHLRRRLQQDASVTEDGPHDGPWRQVTRAMRSPRADPVRPRRLREPGRGRATSDAAGTIAGTLTRRYHGCWS